MYAGAINSPGIFITQTKGLSAKLPGVCECVRVCVDYMYSMCSIIYAKYGEINALCSAYGGLMRGGRSVNVDIFSLRFRVPRFACRELNCVVNSPMRACIKVNAPALPPVRRCRTPRKTPTTPRRRLSDGHWEVCSRARASLVKWREWRCG